MGDGANRGEKRRLGAGAEARDAELVRELPRTVGHCFAHRVGLEQDRLAALRQDFADQKLIFEKFGRATVDGGTKPGTGLGLLIARSIAEAHGGSLEVDSAPAHGSIFTLELPLG